jgi:hypothetical protein
MLQGDLKCLEALLMTHSKWDYFINQAGTALPLIKVSKMAAILNQLNASDSIVSEAPKAWAKTRYQYQHVLR